MTSEASVELTCTMSRSPLIICFGDSLTAGFQSPTRENPSGRDTPYGQFLPSHYVPILGGTNDLGWNASLQDIFDNLISMYDQVLRMGGLPIPVTIPSIRVEDAAGSREGQEWVQEHVGRRRRLNQLIQKYADSKGIAYVDLFGATAEPESGQLAANYSNDGIHLTTGGYGLFAERVAQVLKPLLAGSVQA